MKNEPSSELELRLLLLVQAVREGRDAGAHAELNDLLRADARARALMPMLLVDEQALISMLRESGFYDVIAGAEGGGGKARRMWSAAQMAAIAAGIVFAALTTWWVIRPQPEGTEPPALTNTPPSPEHRQVAIVMQAVDAEWPDAGYQAQDRVPAGPIVLKSGLVRLQFLNGATVVMQGPAALDLKSESLAVVRSGLVTANVPPVAEGFTLVAEGWRAVDRGTVFGIDARQPGKAEVHVLQGKVDMYRAGGDALEDSLTVGQTLLLTENTMQKQAASSTRYPTEDEVLTRATNRAAMRLDAWKQHSDSLAADPSLLLYLDFEKADVEKGILTNRALKANADSSGTLIGGEWTEGRWPGKRAVAFQRAGEVIRLSLRQTATASTFVMSVRFDPVSPNTQTLLLSPVVGPGQIYWLLSGHSQIDHGNGMIFIKTPAAGGGDLHFASGRGFGHQERGRWQMVAVVHDPDRQEVRHYVNGIRTATVKLADKTPLDLGQLAIGNWGYDGKVPNNFVGRMDEVAVFARALEDADIRRLQHGVD